MSLTLIAHYLAAGAALSVGAFVLEYAFIDTVRAWIDETDNTVIAGVMLFVALAWPLVLLFVLFKVIISVMPR